jgi:hypothetical protein
MNDTACHWVVSRPFLWINADFENKFNKKLGQLISAA